MSKILIIPVLFLSSLFCSATTYYVATSGSNSYPGTISQPFLTIQYGVDHLTSPGDILYIRGGKYAPGATVGVNICSGNASGTANNFIKVMAYPNETVYLSGVNFTGGSTTSRWNILVENVNYWYFKGINCIDNPGYNSGQWYGEGFLVRNSTHVKIEQCNVYNCGSGFFLAGNSDYVDYINCDAYNNADHLQLPEVEGDYCNGFTANVSPNPACHCSYTGCRAWHNSDDGFDLYGSGGFFTINNCWSFRNGYLAGGNGAGIKTGASYPAAQPGVQRIVTNCLSFNNLGYGFDKSQDGGPSMLHNFFNNTIYNNGTALNFQYAGASDIIRNNICYANAAFYPVNSNNTADHNNFSNTSQKGSISTTDADFLSVDPAGTEGPRQADGSLPVLNFLRLANGSKLIDAGVNVGFPYSSNAPDLGAYETQAASVATPALVSSSVENASPNKLEMNYNMSLSSSLPPPQGSAFSVQVNSVARNVSAVSVSGTKVTLTLANDVVYGNTVTVAYTKPATNPLQTSSGGQAETIGAQPVTNKTILTVKDVPVTVKMTINPNHVHHFINVMFEYSSSFSAQNAAMSPQIIRIFDTNGKLFAERILVTGVAKELIPVNLQPGIYNVMVSSGSVQMDSQKVVVY